MTDTPTPRDVAGDLEDAFWDAWNRTRAAGRGDVAAMKETIAAVYPLIARAERERCAKVAVEKAAGLIQAGEEMRQYFEMANGRNPAPPMDQFTYQLRATVADDIATDIRALGDGEPPPNA